MNQKFSLRGMLALFLFCMVSFSSLLADSGVMSKYDTWKKYYAVYKTELDEIIGINAEDIEAWDPEYARRMFLVGRFPVASSQFYTHTVTNTYTHQFTWEEIFSNYEESEFSLEFCEGQERVTEADEDYQNGFGPVLMSVGGLSPFCEERTTTEEREVEEKKDPSRFALEPILFFDYDKGRKVINLTPNAEVTASIMPSSELRMGSLSVNLTPASDEKGYRVEQYKRWAAGLGLALTMQFSNATQFVALFKAYAGVLPVRGSMVRAERFAPTKKAIKELPPVKIPYKATDIDSWTIGDKVAFETSGGMMYAAGISFAGIGIGPTYVTMGRWLVEVDKMDDKKVLVQINNTKIKALNKAIGFYMVTASKAEMKSVDRSFSFMFDLSDPKAAEAYEDLLRGNVLGSQNLAADERVHSVLRFEDIKSETLKRVRARSLALPFAYNVVSRSKIQSVAHKEYHPDQSQTDITYGVYQLNRDVRLFSKHRNRQIAFYGAQYQTTYRDGKKEDGHFGQFIWNYQNDHTKAPYLRGEIKKLIRKTGLRNELDTKVSGNGYLGYVNLNAVLTIPKETTNLLIDMATDENKSWGFNKLADAYIANYFKEGRDDNDVCRSYQDDLSTCQTEMVKRTNRSLKLMKMNLKKMGQLRNTDPKAFTKAYASFGEAMLNNQFTFQVVFSLIKGRGASLGYQVLGEKLSYMAKSYDWLPEL